MARHSTSIFGVIFVSVIVSQQYQLSFAQQRSVTCSQTAVKRGQSYGSILEDTQNRAHELDDSFGPIPDFIKYRRKRSHMENLPFKEFSTMRKVLEVNEYNHELKWEEDDLVGYYGDLYGLSRVKRQNGVPGQTTNPNLNSNPNLNLNLNSNSSSSSIATLLGPSLPGLYAMGLIFTLIGAYFYVNQPEIPNPLLQGVGQPPQGFQPQPGSPGGGGIPSGSTLIQAQNLLDRLGLLGLPVAVFPPYADGSFVSPRTGFRTFATIFTDTITLTDRIAQRKIYRWNRRQPYGFYEPLYGVAVETFFIENEFCSDDPYAYNSCSKYDEFLVPSNQIANSRQGENSFISNKPTCRIT